MDVDFDTIDSGVAKGQSRDDQNLLSQNHNSTIQQPSYNNQNFTTELALQVQNS